jgi:hypothetical protein
MKDHDVLHTDCTDNNKHNRIGSFNNSSKEAEEIIRILKSSSFFILLLVKLFIYAIGFMISILKATEMGCHIFFLIGFINFFTGLFVFFRDLNFWDKIKK